MGFMLAVNTILDSDRIFEVSGIDLRNASSAQNAESDSIAALWRGGRVEATPETTDHGHVGVWCVERCKNIEEFCCVDTRKL